MHSPKHVAINGHLLSGEATYRSAGIHGYMLNTLRCLADVEPGWRYSLYTGPQSIQPDPRLQLYRSRLATHNPLVRIVWEQLAAPFVMARDRPDLLHGMAFSLPLAWFGPSVVTIYDMSFIRYPERLGRGRRLYLRAMTRYAARRAKRVIAISESGRAEISLLLGIAPSKIDVAVPGVGHEFRPVSPEKSASFRKEFDLPERFILYVGTLEPRKNLETLVRAYAKLPQRNGVKLVLAGATGWKTDTLYALLDQLDLSRDVILTGYVSSHDLAAWYTAAEVFAYPSVYEGYGLPLLEAMACGLPVIAANTSSLPEAVGESGMLVDPRSVEAWAEALASLLDNQERRRQLSVQGIERASQFTWANTARQTVASYHRALGIQS
jgi:glycosyltransferase involved in cell wall biosynthesis